VPIVFHADPQSFAQAAQSVASRSPCSEALVAIWCASLTSHPPARDVPFLLVTAEASGARAIAMQHGHALLLEHSDPAAVSLIAHALADLDHAVPGIEGDAAACAAFVEAWQARTGRVAAERFRLRHHMLEDVSPVRVPSGASRRADERDAEWLVRAHDAFTDEAKVPRAPQGTERMVRQRLADARYRLWEDRGIVSFLAANLIDGGHARIGPVYTPPEHRGRGYATALVASASRELIARGAARVFLTTDLANPVSNAIYARVGFRAVDDTVAFDLVAP
jgi:predicted GNAT family acetyltransferase